MDVASVRAAVTEGRLTWQQHALQRLLERGISRDSVVQAILEGDVIEDYPNDFPLPSALLLHTDEQRPIHAVVAWDEDDRRAYIVTVYIPDARRFEDDLRTRRT